MAKNVICLWYNDGAEEAAKFYAKTFPPSSVGAVHYAPGDYPAGKQGDALTVDFTVLGIPASALMAVRMPNTAKPSRSRSRRKIKPKPTATGTPSSITAAKKANADGTRINGACHGKSARAY